MQIVVYVLLALLYVLHNDVWYWDDPAIVLGLPVGITYHLFWSLAVSLCFWLAVRYAWPAELESAAHEGAASADGAPAHAPHRNGRPSPSTGGDATPGTRAP